MNVASVRKMRTPSIRQRAWAEDVDYANRQMCVTRCEKCTQWYFRGTVADGKRAFALHLKSALHTGRNRKRGPQQKTADRHAGRSWA